jgi:hypothetical protein
MQGVIIVWYDRRHSPYTFGESDIYAQRVEATGELGGDLVGVQRHASPSALDVAVQPNPSHASPLRVTFRLGASTTVTLELLDVTGRRIAAHEVGALGRGDHVFTMAEGQHLAPGIYFVCLRQGQRMMVTRVAVLD